MASSKSDEIASRKYFQSNGQLVNKFGIKDKKTLEKAEAKVVENTLVLGLSKKSKEVSIDGLKSMHKQMFGDVYFWAGEFRDYTTGRGSPFCRPEYIESSLNKIYDKVNKDVYPRMSTEAFVKHSAEFIGELNSIHPFVDGNGRTQRQSLQNLANKAEKSLDLSKLNRDDWYKAAELSHNEVDYSGFEKIIGSLTRDKTQQSSKSKPTTLERQVQAHLSKSNLPESTKSKIIERLKAKESAINQQKSKSIKATKDNDLER